MIDPNRCRIVVTSPDGAEYFPCPAGIVASAEGSTELYGGHGSSSLTLCADDGEAWLADARLPPFARVEMWRGGVCRHRSYLTEVGVTEGSPSQAVLRGAGLVQARCADVPVDRVLQKKVAADLSEFFQDLAVAFVLPLFPDVVIRVAPVGVKRERLDFTGKGLQECLDALVDEAGGAASWGCYVAEDVEGRPDLVWFGPVSTDGSDPEHGEVVPRQGVSAAGGERRFGDIKTCVRIEGGVPNNPNLLPNPGFSRPVRAGGKVANLFKNPSMAENGDFWGGGGSWKPAGGEEGEGADEGGFWEVDGPGEGWRQVETVIDGIVVGSGEPHELAFRWRNEQAEHPGTIHTLFYWTQGGVEAAGTRVEETWHTTGDGLPPAGQAGPTRWTRRAYPVPAPPAGTDGYFFESEMTSAGGQREGVLFDAAELIQTTALRQEGWELVGNGAGKAADQDWLWPDDAGDGSGACLRVVVTGAEDDDGDDVQLQLIGRQRYSHEGGKRLRQIAHFKADPLGGSSPKIQLELAGFDEGGKGVLPSTNRSVPAGALDTEASALAAGLVPVAGRPGWYRFDQTRDAAVRETGGTAIVEFRSPGACLVDMLSVRDAEEEGWCPADRFVASYKAHELFADSSDPADPDHDVYRSSLPYPTGCGERWHRLSVPSITNGEDAGEYARRWLRKWARGAEPPRITLTDPDEKYLPGEQFRVLGPFGAKLPRPVQPVVRVREAWGEDGVAEVELSLEREWRDETDDLLEMVERRLARDNAALSSPATTGAAGSGSGAGGGYVTGGADLATAASAGTVRTDVTEAGPDGAVVVTKATYDAGQAAQDGEILEAQAAALAVLDAVTDTPERLARYGLGGVLLATSIVSDGDNVGLDDGELWTRHVRLGEHQTSLDGTAFRGMAARPRAGDFPFVFRAVPSGSATRSQFEVYSRSLFNDIGDGDYRAIFQADGATINLGSDFATSTLDRLNLILKGQAQAWLETSGYLSVRRGLALTPYANVAPAEGQIWYEDGVGVQARVGGATVTLAAIGSTPGTVTSVGIAAPSSTFTVSGSPVTGSGTLTLAFQNQAAAMFFAGPVGGGPSAPTWRNIAPNDVPFLDAGKITTGIFNPGLLASGTANDSTVPFGDGVYRAPIRVKDEGNALAYRRFINFTGAGVTATDDGENVVVNIPGGGGGGGSAAVRDEGVLLPARGSINFTGAGVAAVDDAANDRINIEIPGSAGASAVAELVTNLPTPSGATQAKLIQLTTDPSLLAYNELVMGRASLRHFWRLNESNGNVLDVKGAADFAFPANVTRPADPLTGDRQSSYQFTQSGGLLQLPALTGWPFASWTLECWARLDSMPFFHNLWRMDPNFFCFAFSGSLFFAFGSGSGSTGDQSVPFAAGTTYHVAATWDGSRGRLYLNGVKVYESGVLTFAPGNSFRELGGYSPQSTRWNGRISKGAIYNAALTDAQISEHHLAGNRTDTEDQLYVGRRLITGSHVLTRLGYQPLEDSLAIATTSQVSVGQSFTTLPFNAKSVDPGACVNLSTGRYVVPYTGTYAIVSKIRTQDSPGNDISWGQGVHSSNADGSWFLWSTSRGTRVASANTRIARFLAGDQLRLYAYWDSGSPTNMTGEVNIYALTRE